MAKISDLRAKPKALEVPFGEVPLNVEYLPLSYTVREMELISESKDAKQIVDTMKRLVHSWDLEDDNGIVKTDHPRDEDGNVQNDDPLMDIPTHIFTEILKRVAEDQKPSGEAGRPSRAS